mmetsp:Transcript_60708/g.192669  ORF Transcript_60708/g.192669 Transcript_60708/m.192669 type:complete len:306 (+) Transcript_60708:151-1068(+)
MGRRLYPPHVPGASSIGEATPVGRRPRRCLGRTRHVGLRGNGMGTGRRAGSHGRRHAGDAGLGVGSLHRSRPWRPGAAQGFAVSGISGVGVGEGSFAARLARVDWGRGLGRGRGNRMGEALALAMVDVWDYLGSVWRRSRGCRTHLSLPRCSRLLCRILPRAPRIPRVMIPKSRIERVGGGCGGERHGSLRVAGLRRGRGDVVVVLPGWGSRFTLMCGRIHMLRGRCDHWRRWGREVVFHRAARRPPPGRPAPSAAPECSTDLLMDCPPREGRDFARRQKSRCKSPRRGRWREEGSQDAPLTFCS